MHIPWSIAVLTIYLHILRKVLHVALFLLFTLIAEQLSAAIYATVRHFSCDPD